MLDASLFNYMSYLLCTHVACYVGVMVSSSLNVWSFFLMGKYNEIKLQS
jgi:hypothetical protein